MKRIICFVLIISFVFVSAGFFANATDSKNYYYIDAIDGDDSNSGTSIDNAVKTIAALKDY